MSKDFKTVITMNNMLMKKQSQKGFTLIELLVVVAIIGLLSAIVLGSLQTARDKGNDSKKLQMVSEWKKALELYYDDNGQYPATSTLGSFSYSCLGSGYTTGAGGEECILSGDEVDEPTDSLASYYADAPIPEASILISGYNVGGIGYRCSSNNTDCSGYEIAWWQHRDDDGGCGEGVLSGEESAPYYRCEITK